MLCDVMCYYVVLDCIIVYCPKSQKDGLAQSWFRVFDSLRERDTMVLGRIKKELNKRSEQVKLKLN